MQPASTKLFKKLPPSNVGRLGESIAVSFLTRKNFRILTRNFRARYGEIDIVALDGNTLVFVEVKTRSSTTYGSPKSAVGITKIREIIRTGQYYVLEHPGSPNAMRIDVVSIMLNPLTHKTESLEYIRNVY